MSRKLHFGPPSLVCKKGFYARFLPPQPRDQKSSGLHNRARLLGTKMKTGNSRWSKMAKGKDPKPI